ncbi:hypothetical protein MSMAC_1883 [Methanosarcina mazei C16]|uniref:PASTA domain-containing protein n=1 Tax=Methanosarcina mazei C16 TaxID=1434113 RepID=A0A0E3S051_METMZ|nr:PASTA domain-containing protein [Methanosarcina mazei]AKB71773.1 hypothetical protein MSMAC_1883 [Methanosarcina mazei C16]
MTNITDLRSSLDALRKAGTIDATSYTSLATKLNSTETELQSIQKEALAYKESSDRLLLEKFTLEQEKSSLVAQVTKLSNEKAELESRISVLQKSRPALSPSNLVSSFASSLAEMDMGLKKTLSGSKGSKYSVSSMNVTLKTNIALEGEELRFQMPKADDILSPENLSTIEFSIRAAPEKQGIESCKEVPDLVGLSKEEAENKLFGSGFKTGEILENESSAPQGTVTAQLPSGGSLAEPGAAVDLTVSKILSVKVPDFTGLALEAAKILLEKSRLRLEGVKEKPSDSTPGTVLAQSLAPGTEARVDSAIVLTISTQAFKVPNLLGLELDSAKKVIEKSGLIPGGIKKQPSSGKPGIVLTQSPRPGFEVEANSKVDLTVSAEEKVTRETGLEMPMKPLPETAVKEEISKVLSEALSKLQSENTSGTSGENSSTGSAARTPSGTQVKIPEETQVKTSAEIPIKASTNVQREVQAEFQAEPSIKFPARVESPAESPVMNQVNTVESSVEKDLVETPVKVLNEKALPEETIPVRITTETVTPGTIKPDTSTSGTATSGTVAPNTVTPNTAAVNNAALNAATLNSAASLKIQSAVSPEPKAITVPDVTGVALDKAVSLLAVQGIKAGNISETISTVAAGTVLSQDPGPGSTLNPSAPVNLVVSKQAPVTQLRSSTLTKLRI